MHGLGLSILCMCYKFGWTSFLELALKGWFLSWVIAVAFGIFGGGRLDVIDEACFCFASCGYGKFRIYYVQIACRSV